MPGDSTAQSGPIRAGGYEFRCARCGYALRGTGIDKPCPECGLPVMQSVLALTPVVRSGSMLRPGLILGAALVVLGVAMSAAPGIRWESRSVFIGGCVLMFVSSLFVPVHVPGLSRSARRKRLLISWGVLVFLVVSFVLVSNL